jgi:2',3'-cyclic-nucleotide 2'-phosphodiesterase (5'-nucleotidase family)
MRELWLAAILLCHVACSGSGPGATAPAGPAPADQPRPVLITVVGTNDLHGHIDRLPVLGGYVEILRRVRAADGGAVLVFDAGDMFQGTLESNLNEGEAVVEAYGAIGYTAVAIGNHEFDFGPVGERVTPEEPGDDPQGAIKARAAQASFPFLAANVIAEDSGRPVAWPNVVPSFLWEGAGVRIGVVGVTTEATPHTTIATNLAGLAIAPLVDAIAAESAALRSRGADAVIVVAHAGGRCREFDDPRDLSSCDLDHEIFRVLRALPAGSVDVVVAGHTHAGIAHLVDGVAVIEAFSNGLAFGRVDLAVAPGEGVVDARIHPPRYLCRIERTPCDPGEYEGRAVAPDPRVAEIVGRWLEEARALRDRSLGVEVVSRIGRSYREESALGNLLVDLMLAARPEADVAITNGGGIRADLPAGPLTYGRLHEVIPFDNRFARVRLTGAQLRRLVASNLGDGRGIFSLGGIRASARCRGADLEVTLEFPGGRAVSDDAELLLLTSDFLAHGGDRAIAQLELASDAFVFETGPTIRDELAAVLERRGGSLSGEDPDLFDPGRRRLDYAGERPIRCR